MDPSLFVPTAPRRPTYLQYRRTPELRHLPLLRRRGAAPSPRPQDRHERREQDRDRREDAGHDARAPRRRLLRDRQGRRRGGAAEAVADHVREHGVPHPERAPDGAGAAVGLAQREVRERRGLRVRVQILDELVVDHMAGPVREPHRVGGHVLRAEVALRPVRRASVGRQARTEPIGDPRFEEQDPDGGPAEHDRLGQPGPLDRDLRRPLRLRGCGDREHEQHPDREEVHGAYEPARHRSMLPLAAGTVQGRRTHSGRAVASAARPSGGSPYRASIPASRL